MRQVAIWTACVLAAVSLAGPVQAQSTIEKLFGITEARTQELTPYWSEGLGTLLEIFCTNLRCEAERQDDDDHYIFSLKEVELPASEFGFESEAILQVETVRALISRNGLRDFNGFPEAATLSIEGITLNDEGILEIAEAIFEGDTRMQRLIAREIAKEKLSISASLVRQESVYTLDFSARLLSEDEISGSLSLLTSGPVLAYLLKDEVSAAQLDEMEDATVRGAMLYDSIAWEKVPTLPMAEAIAKLYEVRLLDKIFGPFLIERKSEGEKEFWDNVKVLVVAVAEAFSEADRIKGTNEDLIGVVDFYSNWRSKGGNLSVAISAEQSNKLLQQFESDGFDQENENICGVESALVPVFLSAIGVALPYIPEISEFFDNPTFIAMADDEEFITSMKKDIDENVAEIMKESGCPTGTLTFSYAPGE